MPNTVLIHCVIALISIKEVLISLSVAARRLNPAAKSEKVFLIPYQSAAQRRKKKPVDEAFLTKSHFPAEMRHLGGYPDGKTSPRGGLLSPCQHFSSL